MCFPKFIETEKSNNCSAPSNNYSGQKSLFNAFFVYCRYYETSAATGQGVHEMFGGVLATVVEAKHVKAKPVISTAEQSKHK